MSEEVNKVSTRDVAAVAGVSATLVSWVAKGTATQHRIPEVTQRRVRAAIEQLGYRPAGPAGPAVVGCSVAQLLSERPAGSLSATTKQPDNLTTILSSTGYRLVPVENVDVLGRMPREGLVGILYRKAPSPSAIEQLDYPTTLPPPAPAPTPETPHLNPLPPLLRPDVEDYEGHEGERKEELAAVAFAVAPEAAEPKVAPPPVVEVVPSVSEPEPAPAPTPETPAPTYERGSAPDPVVDVVPAVLDPEPIPSSAPAPEAPTPTYAPVLAPAPVIDVVPSASEVAADVSAAVVADEDQLGTDAADTAATTEETGSGTPVVTAVPAVVNSVVQPGTNAADMSAEVPEAGTSASLVAEPETAPIPETPPPAYERVLASEPEVEIAPSGSGPEPAPAPVPTPETPHLNPLPQGERKEELAAVAFAVAPEAAEPKVAPPPPPVVEVVPSVSEPEIAPAPAPTPETPHLNPLLQGERKEELAAVAFAIAPEAAEPKVAPPPPPVVEVVAAVLEPEIAPPPAPTPETPAPVYVPVSAPPPVVEVVPAVLKPEIAPAPAPTPEAPTPTCAPVSTSSPLATEELDNLTTAPQAPSVSEVAEPMASNLESVPLSSVAENP
jgi:hypothetical protein